MSKNKMTKNTIPEGFTVPMALVDFLPVLFFGVFGIYLGRAVHNPFVEICSVIVFLSGLVKVIWKIIAAVKQKNIWLLFVQMRIIMPIGYLAMIGGVIYSFASGHAPIGFTAFLGLPQILFFILGILGLALMIFCAARLDSSDPKSNWIEQAINSCAQAFFMIGMMIVYYCS